MKSATHTPKQSAHPPKASAPTSKAPAKPATPPAKSASAAKSSTTAAKPSAPASKPTSQAEQAQGLGAQHAWLAKEVGSWDVTYKTWMKPGDAPVDAVGQATFTALFDGRYITEKFTSEIAGKPFEGIGTMGYDSVAQYFVNTWYDTMGTGIFSGTGTASADDQEVTFRGSMWCREQNEQMQVRHVRTHESDDRFTLVMYNEIHGEEHKAMEVIYTRKQ